jgi:hypothetical protein
MIRASVPSVRAAVAAAVLVALVVPVIAFAHTERPAYWPQPEADRAVKPPAGGKVPKARSLTSALKRSKPGRTRVVCKRNSLRRLRKAVRRGRKRGYDIRPHDHRKLSRKRARRLRRVNRRLAAMCRYRQIQRAVFASRNNDRIVIMPGVYTEPTARAKPTHDPRCDKYEVNGDPASRTGAASYAYQFNCPNDQNLIAVMGRRLGGGEDPDPPRWDRHGIPNLGRCIRCNLQIEGSGVSADDVVIEAGSAAAGNGGPSGVGAKKDVGVRADRADGFVLRRLTVRHAAEHGIYVIETDGYLLDRFKAFYSGLYGTLTFVDDHGIQQNCEAVGHGDSGLYPGAPVETGEQRPPGTEFRFNQQVRRCDSYHNLAGYSATNGNAVWIHHNNFYDNALGFNTDVATAPGHPGFPGDSQLIEHNDFYSNNFNLYDPDSDVEPAFPYPVGTGIWIAGGNNHTIRYNRFWDNWRRGSMVFAVPDQLVCGPAAEGMNEQAGCDPNGQSTSNRNRIYGNVMGIAPDGRHLPNGTDFWWDSFPGNVGNCWYENHSYKPITTSPSPLPDCDNGRDPGSSVGTGDPANEGELGVCAIAFVTGDFDPESSPCPWFDTPPPPSSDAARTEDAEQRAAMREAFLDFCAEVGPTPTCDPFEPLLRDN